MKKLFIATSNFYELNSKKIFFFKKKGLIIKKNPLKKKLNQKELLRLSENPDYIIAGTETYNKYILKKLNKLKFIFRLGSGTDNIDLKYLKSKNIKFSKSKITPEISVAELIVGYILILYKKIHLSDKDLRNKIWNKQIGYNLNKKTIGIIGYGKVGRYLAKLLKGFGVKILINDIKLSKNKNTNLNYLLKNSDIISLNTSIKNSKKILSKANLNLLRKNCIVINTSRPETLDYDHLFTLLSKKKILGAGLDVFEKEPYYGKFCKLDNVIMTPHIAGYSKEVRSRMENEALDVFEKIFK